MNFQLTPIFKRIHTKVLTTNSFGINAFHGFEDIAKFLRALGLCREAKNKQGFVIAKDIRLRCAVLSLLWVAYASHAFVLRFFWTYWSKKPWITEAYNELGNSILLHIQVFLVVWSSANESADTVRRYYDDLTRLDNALNLRNVYFYRRERRILNFRFFSLSFCYFVKVICETGFWIASLDFMNIWPFFNDIIANFIQMISQFHLFVHLNVLRTRLETLNEKLEFDSKICTETKFETNTDRYVKIMMKYRFCYVLICSEYKIINQIHGLKVTMSIICHIVCIVRTIYVMLVLAMSEGHIFGVVACLIRIVPDTLLFIGLVIYIARISHLRQRLLDTIEKLLCTRTLSEIEQRSVLSLVELIHRQPLQFTAYGFFTLDLPLLCTILNFVVTYIVILTQMRSPTKLVEYVHTH